MELEYKQLEEIVELLTDKKVNESTWREIIKACEGKLWKIRSIFKHEPNVGIAVNLAKEGKLPPASKGCDCEDCRQKYTDNEFESLIVR